MSKYPVYLQDDETSCGVYCIKMILKYYGVNEDAINIKRKVRPDSSGSTIKGMIEALHSYNIESMAYKASLDDIEETLSLPCILHCIQGELGHYVVLYEIKKEQYIIGDPSIGIVKYSREELSDIYSQNVISINHLGRYYDYSERTYGSFLKGLYKLYKREIHQMIKVSLLIAVISYIITGLYSFMIDFIHTDSPIVMSLIVCMSYFLLNVMKILLERTKEKNSILFHRSLDKEYVYQSAKGILDLPEDCFYQDIGMIHSKIISLYDLSGYTIEFFKAVFIDLLVIIVLMAGMCLICLSLAGLILLDILLIILYVKYKSKDILSFYKHFLQAHNCHSQKLLSFIGHRNLGRVYLGKAKYIKDYDMVYEKEANAKEDQRMLILKMSMSIEMLSLIGTIMILVMGLYLYRHHLLSMGHIFMFYMLHSLMIPSVMNSMSVFVQFKQSAVLYEHYKEFLEREALKEEIIEEKVKDIYLNNVSFSYGYHQKVLSHFDLHINQSLFVVGANGSGKSTFLRLINGEDTHFKGKILINNQDITTIKNSSLHQRIAYIHQDGFIEGTVFDNLMCEDIDKIEKISHVLDYPELFTQLEISLKEDGSPLSAGQQQLLILARALLHDCDVYLLDEAFSHVDFKKAKRIIRSIKEHYPDKLFIIVTHRNNLMNKGDTYVIIETGKVKDIRVRR